MLAQDMHACALLFWTDGVKLVNTSSQVRTREAIRIPHVQNDVGENWAEEEPLVSFRAEETLENWSDLSLNSHVLSGDSPRTSSSERNLLPLSLELLEADNESNTPSPTLDATAGSSDGQEVSTDRQQVRANSIQTSHFQCSKSHYTVLSIPISGANLHPTTRDLSF